MRKFLSHIKCSALDKAGLYAWFLVAFVVCAHNSFTCNRWSVFNVTSNRSDNKNLRNFGQSLASWILQIMQFLTFNSNSKPFPFDDWPNSVLSEGFSIDDEPSVTVNEDEPVDDSDIPSFTSEGTFDVDTEVKGSKKT